nr:pyridoxal-phosphate dependent enzyme [Marinomonas sp. KJ51-3]
MKKPLAQKFGKTLMAKLMYLLLALALASTITGVSRYIKNTQGKAIISVAVEPTSSPVITQTLNGEDPTPSPHKIQGIGAGFVPKNLDLSMVDRVEQVTNEDAIAMAKRLMREEGILCGISCGAAVVAAERASQLAEFKDKKIVVVLPDSGERYLSTALFEGELPTTNWFSNH